jgi:hypothetical protein
MIIKNKKKHIKFFIYLNLFQILNVLSNQYSSLIYSDDNNSFHLNNYIDFYNLTSIDVFNYETNNIDWIKSLNRNKTYLITSIESSEYLTCKNFLNYLSNLTTILMSHKIIDCDDLVLENKIYTTNNSIVSYESTSSGYKILTLGASVYQLHSAIDILIKKFSLKTYAIIYSNNAENPNSSTYYKNLAENLIDKLSTITYASLSFSVSADSYNLNKLIENFGSYLKSMYLLKFKINLTII